MRLGKQQPNKENISFKYVNGFLYRQWKPRNPQRVSLDQQYDQIVLPMPYRRKVLELAHDIPMAGHLAKAKTTERILRSFYWPRMFHDIKKYCKSCEVCQKTSKTKPNTKAKLIPLAVTGVSFSRIAMDIIGPLERSTSDNRYILVVCDYVTRYPEPIPMRNCEAQKIAEELLKIFSSVGIPKEVLTGQGSNFTSKFLFKIYQQLGI